MPKKSDWKQISVSHSTWQNFHGAVGRKISSFYQIIEIHSKTEEFCQNINKNFSKVGGFVVGASGKSEIQRFFLGLIYLNSPISFCTDRCEQIQI